MLASGWLGDLGRKRRLNARMLMSGAAVLLAVPAAFLALLAPAGALPAFVLFQSLAAFLMYTYYPLIYATIHDIVEPALRGRAMALYFFAMYMLGASLGPVATGWLSPEFSQTVHVAWSQQQVNGKYRVDYVRGAPGSSGVYLPIIRR